MGRFKTTHIDVLGDEYVSAIPPPCVVACAIPPDINDCLADAQPVRSVNIHTMPRDLEEVGTRDVCDSQGIV